MKFKEKDSGLVHWIMVFLRLCYVIFVIVMSIIQVTLKRILHFMIGAFKADDDHHAGI